MALIRWLRHFTLGCVEMNELLKIDRFLTKQGLVLVQYDRFIRMGPKPMYKITDARGVVIIKDLTLFQLKIYVQGLEYGKKLK